MSVIRSALCAALALLPLSTAAQAGPQVDAMANCLVLNTTGAERLLLVRWITFAFAAHPQAGAAMTVDTSQIEPTDKELAQLFTALITERCAPETKAAFAAEGAKAFEGAFAVLGTVSTQELSRAPEVTARMTGFMKYIDEAQLEAVLK